MDNAVKGEHVYVWFEAEVSLSIDADGWHVHTPTGRQFAWAQFNWRWFGFAVRLPLVTRPLLIRYWERKRSEKAATA